MNRILLWSTIIIFVNITIYSAEITSTKGSKSSSKNIQHINLGITISGGVSLGLYQAGYLYASTEWLKRNEKYLKPKVLTGASAGSINALLLALELSKADMITDPRESSFYKGWIDIGIKSLQDTAGNPNEPYRAFGMFKRDVIKSFLHRELKQLDIPLKKDLDLVIGITGTRVHTEKQRIKNLKLPYSDEKFVFRFKGSGDSLFSISNYVNRESSFKTPILNLSSDSYIDTSLSNVVLASSSFPLAFPPYEIPLKMIVPKNEISIGQRYDSISSKEENVAFLDGGIFDNAPLRLAYRLASQGLYKNDNGALEWKNIRSNRTKNHFGDSLYYVYLDPNNSDYRLNALSTKKSLISGKSDLFTDGGTIISEIFTSTMANELNTLLEEAPHLAPRIQYTENYYPQMSAFFNNFLGFFYKEFREFDFLLGMYDAEQYLNIARNAINAELHKIHKNANGVYVSEANITDYISGSKEIKRQYNLIKTIFDAARTPTIKGDIAFIEVSDIELDSVDKVTILPLVKTSIDLLWSQHRLNIGNHSYEFTKSDSILYNMVPFVVIGAPPSDTNIINTIVKTFNNDFVKGNIKKRTKEKTLRNTLGFLTKRLHFNNFKRKGTDEDISKYEVLKDISEIAQESVKKLSKDNNNAFTYFALHKLASVTPGLIRNVYSRHKFAVTVGTGIGLTHTGFTNWYNEFIFNYLPSNSGVHFESGFVKRKGNWKKSKIGFTLNWQWAKSTHNDIHSIGLTVEPKYKLVKLFIRPHIDRVNSDLTVKVGAGSVVDISLMKEFINIRGEVGWDVPLFYKSNEWKLWKHKSTFHHRKKDYGNFIFRAFLTIPFYATYKNSKENKESGYDKLEEMLNR